MNTADTLIQQREKLAPTSPHRRKFNQDIYGARHAQIVAELPIVHFDRAWEAEFTALVREADLGCT